MHAPIVTVAVPVPLRQTFDFYNPKTDAHFRVGARVLVPFGKRQLVGVITDIKQESDYPLEKLKPIIEVLDSESCFDDQLWETLLWLSQYYLAPIGEVFELALPVALRKKKDLTPKQIRTWSLSDHGRIAPVEELSNAPLQIAIVKRLQHKSVLTAEDFKEASSGWRSAISALEKKGWVQPSLADPVLQGVSTKNDKTIQLKPQQIDCISTLSTRIGTAEFSCSLLLGVTGSGKTQVYFEVMQEALDNDQQILLLVPEIGLTPQLIERAESYFDEPICVMHSGLNESERHLAWWHSRRGNARIVIGTRSAIFSSFDNLGLIIVDEEHDTSFKQQEGVRYHARDVAVYRAKLANIPIVLGSATPAFETYKNATTGRYHLLEMNERATAVSLPTVELIDLNHQATSDGLSPALLSAIRACLDSNQQLMLFLNRRGYAPVLYCTDCKQSIRCHRCDSHLTVHRRIQRLRCHHCGYEGPLIACCKQCESKELVEVGEGTQRVEEAIQQRFPNANIARIDRDNTRRKGELAERLRKIKDGDADVVIGTQLITKGHDFPNLSLVAVIDADAGLFSTDYRASEYLFQQLVQVAGRAGRHLSSGHVLIQTHFPDHPFFHFIKNQNYASFAHHELKVRKDHRLPPFSHCALLRAESSHQHQALRFLRNAKRHISMTDALQVFNAVPAPMERRAGRYRAQLLISCHSRAILNDSLSQLLILLQEKSELKKLAASVRWNLDIDPIDHY